MPADYDLSGRLDFMGLDEKAQAAMRSLKPAIEKALPAALDQLYEHIGRTPETARFFAGADQRSRAKAAQLRHWARISAAQYDDDYGRNAQAIGRVHAQVGLEPRWYIGGYALVADALIQAAVAQLWPRGLLGGGKAAAAGAALGALVKAILLDMELAVSVYIDAMEEARSKAEADARQAAEERSRAEAAAAEERRRAEAAAAEESRRAEQARAEAAKRQTAVVDAVTRALAKLAQGDLTVRLSGDLGEAYDKVRDDFNTMAERLETIVASIATSSREVANAANEIATSTEDLSQRTQQQAAGLEQTSASIEEISATVKKNAENAGQANQLTTNARQVANHGEKVVADAIAAMSRIEESSHKIADIIGVIDEIARQTNLLALNAAVEAARAGDAGRGFAVVASEVRSLAQRSSQAAKDIKELITSSSVQVKEGVDLVSQTGGSLGAIVESINRVAGIVADIANASAEQATGIEHVNKALIRMDEATQQNSALVEENSATARTLEMQAGTMHQQVSFFRLGSAPAAAKPAPGSVPGPAATRAPARPPARAVA